MSFSWTRCVERDDSSYINATLPHTGYPPSPPPMSYLSARLIRYLLAVWHKQDQLKVLTAFKSAMRILLLSAQCDGPQPPAETQMSLSSSEDTENSFSSTGLWQQPCHNLPDGWRGQNNHSNWDLHLPKSSDLPDHYPLVTSSSCPSLVRARVWTTITLPVNQQVLAYLTGIATYRFSSKWLSSVYHQLIGTLQQRTLYYHSFRFCCTFIKTSVWWS